VVTYYINNVVMLDILVVKLSLSLANKVAVITFRCNPFSVEKAQICFGGRGSAPDPAGGAYSSPQTPYLGFGRGDRRRTGRGGGKG